MENSVTLQRSKWSILEVTKFLHTGGVNSFWVDVLASITTIYWFGNCSVPRRCNGENTESPTQTNKGGILKAILTFCPAFLRACPHIEQSYGNPVLSKLVIRILMWRLNVNTCLTCSLEKHILFFSKRPSYDLYTAISSVQLNLHGIIFCVILADPLLCKKLPTELTATS